MYMQKSKLFERQIEELCILAKKPLPAKDEEGNIIQDETGAGGYFVDKIKYLEDELKSAKVEKEKMKVQIDHLQKSTVPTLKHNVVSSTLDQLQKDHLQLKEQVRSLKSSELFLKEQLSHEIKLKEKLSRQSGLVETNEQNLKLENQMLNKQIKDLRGKVQESKNDELMDEIIQKTNSAQRDNLRMNEQLEDMVNESLKMKVFYEREIEQLKKELKEHKQIVVQREIEKHDLVSDNELKKKQIERLKEKLGINQTVKQGDHEEEGISEFKKMLKNYLEKNEALYQENHQLKQKIKLTMNIQSQGHNNDENSSFQTTNLKDKNFDLEEKVATMEHTLEARLFENQALKEELEKVQKQQQLNPDTIIRMNTYDDRGDEDSFREDIKKFDDMFKQFN